MRGRGQRDDGWDEGRRDNWQNGNAYQPDTAAGYQGTGYQTGSGDQASSAAGQGYGATGYSGGYTGNGYDAPGASGYGGYGQSGSAPAAQGYAGGGYAQSGYGTTGPSAQYGSEFLPDESASGNDNAAGTPRPYGRLSIFTLLDDKAAEFDRLAERAAEGVRTAEPDTLVYVIHVVPKAPMQRIIYEIYRDRAAFESHEQQPHIQRFVADRRSCVLATNIIDLRLKYAKVTALATGAAPQVPASSPAPGFGQETQQYQSNDRYAAAVAGYSAAPASQYQASGQYAASGTRQYAASGTGQSAALGTGQYAATSQYAAGGSGQYGTGQPSSGQYSSGQYGDGQYSSGQYSSGQYGNEQRGNEQRGNDQYSNGNYGSGQYAAAGTGRHQSGSGRYPELGSGRQPDGGGRHAESAGGYGQSGSYGRTGGYTQSGTQSREPDQDTGTDARTPRFEPAEWDRTTSRAGRY